MIFHSYFQSLRYVINNEIQYIHPGKKKNIFIKSNKHQYSPSTSNNQIKSKLIYPQSP